MATGLVTSDMSVRELTSALGKVAETRVTSTERMLHRAQTSLLLIEH
jgi:hypothetical protein